MIRLGITGTDTGVGKTVVSAAIVALLRRRGVDVAAMKPAETGRTPDDPQSDAALLRAAAGDRDPVDLVRPILLPEPLAPWVAAERAGAPIDLGRLDDAFARLTAGREAVVVEGAGGLLVPITRDLAYDGLFARWGLDVVIVAGNRLGVLNHSLLTLHAARAAGLHVRGIILNALTPAATDVAEDTNLHVLRELAGIPVLPFPWIDGPATPERLADAAESAGLGAMVGV